MERPEGWLKPKENSPNLKNSQTWKQPSKKPKLESDEGINKIWRIYQSAQNGNLP